MDTTKTYIKMCEKAVEIQKQWDIQDGDFFFGGQNKDIDIKTRIYNYSAQELRQEGCIWLPRQAQLQEMVSKDYAKDITRPWVHLCYQFYGWAHLNWCDFTSMEQLWLAFVMKEKYNKVWDGKNWVKG